MSSMRPFNEPRVLTSRHIDGALLVLRLVLGVIMAAHGAQKVFATGMSGVAGGFEHMGIPMAQIMGPLISLLEFGGGILIVLGLLTRIIGFFLACDMLGAMFMVHFKGGFFLPSGYEFVLALAGMSIALALAGAGRYSIDGVIADRRSHTVTTSI